MKIKTVFRNKKIASLLIISSLIILTVGSQVNANGDCYKRVVPINNIPLDTADEIDQEQSIHEASTCLLGSMVFAQSFKPTFCTLTRVKLLLNKEGYLYGNSILSIRESLTGNDLTLVSKESLELNTELEWIEFDFPDIQVTPGELYYIILKPDPDSDGGNAFTFISWAFGWNDYYENGAPYQKYEGSWGDGISAHENADYTFKTYGIDTGSEGDVEIELYAGYFGQDFGSGISIDIYNHKDHNVTLYFNQSFDFIFKHKTDFNQKSVRTIPPDRLWNIRAGLPVGIKRVSISVECEGTNVYREGFSINDFIFLTT